MDVMSAIRQRRSVRKYKDIPIEEEKINNVLEAGRLAPTARNLQDFKIIVVKNKDTKEQLTHALYDQKFATEVPVIMVIVGTNPERVMRCDQYASPIDSSIVLSFMMLAATEEGLGTCWLGSFYQNEVKEILNIPPKYSVIAVTPLGYPDEEPNIKPRKDLKDIVCVEKFE